MEGLFLVCGGGHKNKFNSPLTICFCRRLLTFPPPTGEGDYGNVGQIINRVGVGK